MDYLSILQEIQEEILPYLEKGEVANYIPALKNVDEKEFAMSIKLLDSKEYHIGAINKKFSIQSISKVFAFTIALNTYGKKIYSRVGHEPSGDPFNSLVQLEFEKGIPRNPFINAGAIVTVDALISHFENYEKTYDEFESFLNKISNSKVEFNEEVYQSELNYGFRNISLGNLMKSFSNLHNDVDEVMKSYFKQCSVQMSTKQLCNSMLFLANNGKNPITNESYISAQRTKRINSLMLTCGHYDASGDFAFKVGLPGKSGVGGGIVAVVPGIMAISVYSPKLNKQGNSLAGTKALELFTTKTGLSIF